MALTPAINPFYKDSLRAQEVQRKALGYQPMPDYQIAGERYGELSAELQDERAREQFEEMMSYRDKALSSQTAYQSGMLDLLNKKWSAEEAAGKIAGVSTIADTMNKLFGSGSLLGGTTGILGQGGLLGGVGSAVGGISKALSPGTPNVPAIQTTTPQDPYDPRYGMGTYEPPPQGYDPNVSQGTYTPPPAYPNYNPEMDWGMESFQTNDATNYLLTDEGYQATFGPLENTVICTELYRQGLLEKEIYLADSQFGNSLPPEVLIGYHVWAEKIAEKMKTSPTLTKMVSLFAIPWAKEMAHRIGVRDKGTLLGKVMLIIGVPICGIIGSLVIMNKEVKYA